MNRSTAAGESMCSRRPFTTAGFSPSSVRLRLAPLVGFFALERSDRRGPVEQLLQVGWDRPKYIRGVRSARRPRERVRWTLRSSVALRQPFVQCHDRVLANDRSRPTCASGRPARPGRYLEQSIYWSRSMISNFVSSSVSGPCTSSSGLRKNPWIT